MAKKDNLKAILIEEFGELSNQALHKKLDHMAMENHREYIMSLVARAGYSKMSYSRAYAKIVSISDGD